MKRHNIIPLLENLNTNNGNTVVTPLVVKQQGATTISPLGPVKPKRTVGTVVRALLCATRSVTDVKEEA